AILSDTAAKTFFPGGNPVGLRYQEREREGDNKGKEYAIEIVGVAKDMDFQAPNYAQLSIVFRPVSQCLALCSPISSYEVRFAGPLSDMSNRLKTSAASVDPQLALKVYLLADEINNTIHRNRAMALIAATFGLFVGLLAMIGVYGVTSYATAERTREIGIRMALGAQPGDVFRLILGETIMVVFVGVTFGVAAGFVVARTIRGMLYGVTPNDPLTFAFAACLMLLVAAIAAFLPAYRASKADPMVALRFE
ncbi:MAG: FtsX-like permease family protein, partial [Candidatus Acidiferrales bacterium]